MGGLLGLLSETFGELVVVQFGTFALSLGAALFLLVVIYVAIWISRVLMLRSLGGKTGKGGGGHG